MDDDTIKDAKSATECARAFEKWIIAYAREHRVESHILIRAILLAGVFTVVDLAIDGKELPALKLYRDQANQLFDRVMETIVLKEGDA